MGHIRLGRLPATKKWQQVVALLSRGASLEQIAGASADAAENSLEHARRDPALLQSFWASVTWGRPPAGVPERNLTAASAILTPY